MKQLKKIAKFTFIIGPIGGLAVWFAILAILFLGGIVDFILGVLFFITIIGFPIGILLFAFGGFLILMASLFVKSAILFVLFGIPAGFIASLITRRKAVWFR